MNRPLPVCRWDERQSSDPLGNHWTFTGRFLDEEAGLLYYRARHYDPATGRFLERDPLGYLEGPSLFEYTASNGINCTDPSGMKPAAFPDPSTVPYTPPKMPWGRWLHNRRSVALSQHIWEDLEGMRAIIDDIFAPDENPAECVDPNQGGPTITQEQLEGIMSEIEQNEDALRSVLWDPYLWAKGGNEEDEDRDDVINDADDYVGTDEDYQLADSMFR